MNKLIFIFLMILTVLHLSMNSFAQSDSTNTATKTKSDSSKTPKRKYYIVMETDTVPELMFKKDTLVKKAKKDPKKKKNVFYDLKCRRGFIRYVSPTGDKVILESFYYLKVWKDPNPYILDVYVWDLSKNKIIKVTKIEAEKKGMYRILHGSYEREVNGVVMECGAFYVGTKHARWELYNKDFILIGKTKYYKGWPKEAKISYFDQERKHVKEVIPYEYGKLQGDYYLFTEKGYILSKGRYENGTKVGLWIDYFTDSPNRKRETQYTNDSYDKETQPVIVKEWNDKGKVIILDGKVVPEGSKKQEEEDPIKKRLKKKR
jgi:antitoxin component YwqK of YwqJK toxin-antitoxin module